eukprot:CAMPEP_0184706110 /NCGR_PEP_ID=MMETSP0313-20130426/36587_1 /TAXON_ID=2792 /ORGANISM="Porphyridium aerugineum, Strain SAG 1380-2" /LENGTH=208 /DNA_ID=CAMNT_0027167651 /DNA_START=215 /DNA_END=841 /DNA_ORIENTATION=-
MDDASQVPPEYQSVVSRILLTEPQIHARVAELGAKISADYHNKVFHNNSSSGENGVDDTKNAMLRSDLLVLGVLTGSFIFTADLCRTINIPHQVCFIKAESYEGTSSKGTVNITGLEKVNMHGRHVIVVEDIVDTGLTLQKIKARIMELGCASVSTATLLHKNTNRRIENTPPVEYIAFEIQDEFVVGYGLDYNQALRHLPFVGIFRQ